MTSTEHRALCLDCGRLAIREVINHMQSTATITEATFECAMGHLFIVRWIHTTPQQKEAS